MVKKFSFNKIFVISLLGLLLVFSSIFTYFTFSNRRTKVYADNTSTNFNGSPFLVNTFSSTASDSTTWSAMTWNGLTNFYGNWIWNIGSTYYFSNGGSYQYVLNAATNTWSAMTWNGISDFTHFTGSNVWNVGSTYYYSNDLANMQYVLDTATNTWSAMTWNGLSSFDGSNVWNVGSTYYVSYRDLLGSNTYHYVLDTSTNTWSRITWNGYSPLYVNYIWNIGSTYYYSYGTSQYVLDTSTNTWSAMTWNGLSSFDGRCVWYVNSTYYYSNGTNQYILDTATNTWSAMTWNGFSDINGNYIWNLGNTYYYSSGTTQYSFDLSNVFSPYYYNLQLSFSNMTTSNFDITFNYGDFTHNLTANTVSHTFSSGTADTYTISNISFDNTFTQPVKFVSNSLLSLDFSYCHFYSDTTQVNGVYYFNNYLSYCNSDSSKGSFDIVISSYSVSDVSDTVKSLMFADRYYYFTNTSGADYSQGYSVGYNTGYSKGYTAGNGEGQTTGYSNGYNVGYSVGYTSGAASANDYSFIGLLSAVIDTPIKYISSLFNFDLLGVNMFSFICALFTLCIIVTIVKLVV